MRAFPLVLARIGDEWKSMGFQWKNRNSKKCEHFHLFQHELEMNGNQWDFNGQTGIEKKAGISTCFTTNWILMEINGISMEKQEFKKRRAFPLGLARIGD